MSNTSLNTLLLLSNNEVNVYYKDVGIKSIPKHMDIYISFLFLNIIINLNTSQLRGACYWNRICILSTEIKSKNLVKCHRYI